MTQSSLKPTLTQPTVIITGASSGIGLGLAQAYLAQGWNVVGNARSGAGLEQAHRTLGNSARFIGIAGDIAAPETATALVDTAVSRFGGLDALINNAGFFLPKAFVDYSTADLDALLDTNLKAVVYASQAAARQMLAQGSGHIVNITTSLAMQPNKAVACALQILVKGAVNQLTRALALEYADRNVQVNAVAPGIVDTPMHDPATHAFLRTLQPNGRLASVEDIAAAVLFLTGSEQVTGVILPVDGGAASGTW